MDNQNDEPKVDRSERRKIILRPRRVDYPGGTEVTTRNMLLKSVRFPCRSTVPPTGKQNVQPAV